MPLNFPMLPSLLLLAGLVSGFLAGMLLMRQRSSIRRGAIRIDASTVSGRGAFAVKAVREGDILERCPAIEVTASDVGGELLNYVFYGSSENRRLVAMGYGMLFNHSSEPNVAYYREDGPLGAELIIYALRSIRRGEELFYNYGDEWWATR
jgi:uncharacterized protein